MTTPTYPTSVQGSTAEPVVLVDPATGEPYAAGGSGQATEATLEAVEALLATPATVLPPIPLMAPGDLTGFLLDSTSNSDISIAVAGGVSVKTRLYRGLFTVTGAATTIKLYDDVSASGVELMRWDIPAGGGIIDLPLDGRAYAKSQANKPLVMKQTGGAQLSGNLYYAQGTVA